jgi:glycosyltransferase involved in cell wall biosynthesis
LKAKNKHIVLITPGFPQDENDTTCIPALQIYVKALLDVIDYDISIISLHYPKTNEIYLWNSIPVYSIGSSYFLTKIVLWYKVYKILKKIHNENAITTIHSFWLGECALIGYWFSKKNCINHLTTLMGQDALNKKLYLKVLPLQKMQIISLGEIHQQLIHTNYKLKTHIIPWGINPEHFTFSGNKSIDVIGVGSLTSLKNYDLFITIIFHLNKIKPIKVILIGEGKQKKVLQEKIKSLQLENVITLIGLLNYTDTLMHISKSKILLHTSSYEGFGLVFAEALQSKTMIVSKNVGIAYASENWIIGKNENELIEACSKLLSKSFSEKQTNPFIIEKTLQQYLKIYNE